MKKGRVSQHNPQSHSTLNTSSSFETQAEPQAMISAGRVNPGKGKKRSLETGVGQEQGEDKRPRRKDREGKWQGFEKELDIAGDTVSTAPISLPVA